MVGWQILWGLVLTQAAVVWVAEMSRHGSRAPTLFYPWDEDGRWSIGLGELTNKGMRQHYLIGCELRERYITQQSVFSPSFNSTSLWLQSSDVNRTLMSAQSQLMGLYPTGPVIDTDRAAKYIPPIQISTLQNQLDALGAQALPNQWQPVSIHTLSENLDLMLRPNKACQAIVNYNNELLDMPEYNQTAYSSKLVAEVLEAELGGKGIRKHYLDIWNSILCNSFMGYSLPATFNETFMEEGFSIFNELFAMYYQDDSISRLYSAGFFEELISHLQALQNGSELTTFRYYSSHEETIAGVLAGLGVFNGLQPVFASTLIFEVSDNPSNQYTIRVQYNNETLLIPSCPSEDCPLTTFVTYLSIRSLADYENLCNNSTNVTWSNVDAGKVGSEDIPGKGEKSVSWMGWMTVGLVAVTVLLGLGLWMYGCFKEEAPLSDLSQRKINVPAV